MTQILPPELNGSDSAPACTKVFCDHSAASSTWAGKTDACPGSLAYTYGEITPGAEVPAVDIDGENAGKAKLGRKLTAPVERRSVNLLSSRNDYLVQLTPLLALRIYGLVNVGVLGFTPMVLDETL